MIGKTEKTIVNAQIIYALSNVRIFNYVISPVKHSFFMIEIYRVFLITDGAGNRKIIFDYRDFQTGGRGRFTNHRQPLQ